MDVGMAVISMRTIAPEPIGRSTLQAAKGTRIRAATWPRVGRQ